MEDLTGKQLNQYRVLGPLGEGGMAAVYKAYQANMDREVAVKILPRQYAADPGFLARFEREAKVIAGLEHPHIIPVHDYGQADGYTYLVMRMVPGGTLAERLGKGPLAPPEVVRIVSQIASALDYAHGRGVIHRDIKPSNVLLDPQGNCLLTDFGIAKMVSGATQLTASGAFLGTPRYASPEQGMGRELTGRSDVYSLGVMLYEMATGRAPFEAETPLALIFKHANDPLPLPRTLNPAVPPALEQAILKALAKDPDHRFGSAGDLARAVEAGYRGVVAGGMAGGAGMAATSVEAPARRFPWRWVAFAGLGGVLLLGIGAAAVLLVSSLRGSILPAAPVPTVTRVFATEAVGPSPTEVPSPAAPTEPPVPPAPVIGVDNAASLVEQRLLVRGTVTDLAIDESGNRLAAGGGMGAWIYELDSMQPLRLLDHGAVVAGVAFSPDGSTLATAGADGRIRIWDVESGEALAALTGHNASLSAVAWSSDGELLVSAAYDGMLRIWRSDAWQQAGVIQDLTQGATLLSWIPGTHRFVSGSFDGTVRVWDADRRAMLNLVGSHQQRVGALAVSPDGRLLASGGPDSYITVWDLQSGARVHELFASGFGVIGLAWSGDARLLAEANVIGFLGELVLWDVEAEEAVDRLDDISLLDTLSAMTWNTSSDRLAVATRRGRLALWDSDTGRLLHDVRPHGNSASALAWSPSGDRLALTSIEGRMLVVEVESGEEVASNILEGVGTDLAWSPDDGTLAVSTTGGSAMLLEPEHADVLYELRSGEDFAYAVAWSPDGTQLALAAESGAVTIWDPAAGSKLATLEGHSSAAFDLAWSPDGNRLASSSNDGTLRLWDMTTIVLLDAFGLEVTVSPLAVFDIGATGNAVAWSPDGAAIAVGTLDGRVLVWPVGTAEASLELGLGDMVSRVAWSPSGEIVAVATEAGTLALVQAASGTQLYLGMAHNGSVAGLGFSPDGSMLATAGFDGAIKLWGIP